MADVTTILVTVASTLLGVLIWRLLWAVFSQQARKVWRQRDCFHQELGPYRPTGEQSDNVKSYITQFIVSSGTGKRFNCTACGKEWSI